MNHVLSKEQLQELFDQLLQNAMLKMAGVRFVRAQKSPGEELCTVRADFERGFNSGLSLCAEASVFTRLTQFMMQQESVEAEDVEDFSKEFFNVLCGQICSKLYADTKVPSRFGIPAFYRGRYQPADREEQFALSYCSGWNEFAELSHQTPLGEG